ncbi:MAG: hypothetical protein RLZZ314_1401 [Bacteroidota bacterium]
MTSAKWKAAKETAGRGVNGLWGLVIRVVFGAGSMGLCGFTATGQTTALDSLTTPGMSWHGDLSQWVWQNDDPSDFEGVATMGRWQLQATLPGVHVVWGCPTSLSTNGTILNAPLPPLGNPSHETAFHAMWHWQQGVAGSQANRSEWMWALPPTPNPSESARILAESTQAGWIDGYGGMGTGSSGSDDPLMCWGPDMTPWEGASGCHAWAQPFEVAGWMTWGTAGEWQVTAVDTKGRVQRLVDTVMAQTPAATPPSAPCVGWKVDCTSSNLDRWSLGVRVGVGNPDTTLTTPLYASMLPDAPSSLNLLEPLPASALTTPPALSLIVQPPHLMLPPLTVGPRCPEVQGELNPGSGTGPETWITSDIPQRGACTNVWEVQLPCPMPAEHPTRLSFGPHDIHMWPEGTSLLLPGQIAFTEIMADPTPAMHAPESTYLELVNLSSLAIQVASLMLRDGGEHHALVPRNGELWLPGEILLLVDDLEPWSSWVTPAQSEFHVAKVSGWSGLRDDGESIAIMHGDLVLESLTYDKSWWLPGSQDGISVSALQPEGCDHPENWQPDPEGASPGWLDSANPFHTSQEPVTGGLTLAEGVTLTPWLGDSVVILPASPWDTRKVVWVAMRDSYQSDWSVQQAIQGEGQTWRLAAPKPSGESRTIHVQVTAATCMHPDVHQRVDTMWRMHPLPNMEDLALSEVHANPATGAEFIEWVHLREDTLAWGNSAWAPGQCLVQSPETMAHFEAWHWEAWQDRSPPLWEVRSEVKLPNQGGQLVMDDPWGRAMPLVIHSPCDHDHPSGPESGRSVEWLSTQGAEGSSVHVQRTRTCPHLLGSTPGWVEGPWDDADPWPAMNRPPSEHSAPTGLWGCLDDSWIVIPSAGTDPSLFQSHEWSPPTPWSWTRWRGMPAVTSSFQFSSTGDPILPKHTRVPTLSCPQGIPSDASPHLGELGLAWDFDNWEDGWEVRWNEWLQSPAMEFSPFVEVWNPSQQPVMARDLLWSSADDPDPASFDSPGSDIDWMIPPHEATCFAACPTWVQHGTGMCIPTDIPSLHGERELRLRHRGITDVVMLGKEQHSPWVVDDDGISLGRLPESDLWTSTPAHIGSTPGRPNSAHSWVEDPRARGRLSCSPGLIQPGLGEDLVIAEVSLPTHAPCHLEWFVHPVERLQANPAMMKPLARMTSGLGMGTWTWHGGLANGQPADPGNHFLTVRWQCPRIEGVERSGVLLRGVDRCLIAVTP